MQALLDNFNPNVPIRLSENECTYTGYTRLIYLIDLNVSSNIIQEFLKNTDDDINDIFESYTPIAWLCSCARIYNLDTLKVMVKYGANIKNTGYHNLLRYVITVSKVEDINLIHYLLEQNLRVGTGYITSLIRHNLITSFRKEAIKHMIENKQDLNEREEWTGLTALSRACLLHRLDNIQFLLDLGADPNAPGNCHYGSFNNHCIINLLLFNGLPEKDSLQKIMDACYLLFQYGAVFKLVNDRGETVRSLLENKYYEKNDTYLQKYRCRFWNDIDEDGNTNVDKIIKFLEQFCVFSYTKSARNVAK